jgi:RNA polymerase sigma-70 factor (ECF subfamily)
MRITEPRPPARAGKGRRDPKTTPVEGAALSQPPQADRSELWSALLAERDRAKRVARARCSSPHDAEDCVQEAMARVAAMPDVDASRVGPLLSTVVANLATDTHRARARAARAEPRLVAAGLPHPSPEEEVCDVLEARWLWDRRMELPDQDRAVLELRTEGRTAGQAAEALGVTYKAAESAYTRARSRMMKIWRTAAALLGILWGRPARESAPVTVPVAASATIAVLALLTAVLPGAGGRAEAGEGAGPRRIPAAATLPATASAKAPAPAGLRPERTAPSSSPPVSPGAQTAPRPAPVAAPRAVLLPGAAAGPIYAPDVQGGQQRTDESLTDTVGRCLREGVVVTPTYVNCAG